MTKRLMPTAAGDGTSPRYDAYTYTDDGLLYQQTTPDPSSAPGTSGRVTTTSQFDVQGNLVSRTDPAPDSSHPQPVTTTYTWSRDHLNLRVDDPAGPNSLAHSQTFADDANANQTRVTDAVGAYTQTYYTTNNLKDSVQSPAGGAVSGSGTDSNPYVSSYTNDQAGNVISMTNPNLSAKDPDAAASPVTYKYSGENLLMYTDTPSTTSSTCSTNCVREVLDWYDTAGQRMSESAYYLPDSYGNPRRTLGYQYYLDGRLAGASTVDNTTGTSTAPKTFSYDADGNMTSAGANVSADYYIDGTLLSTNDNAYVAQWTYDGAGRMATLTAGPSGASPVGTEAAQYTDYGQQYQIASTQYNAGNSAEVINYDKEGRRTQVAQSNADVLSYQYSTDNTLNAITVNQGSSTSRLCQRCGWMGWPKCWPDFSCNGHAGCRRCPHSGGG